MRTPSILSFSALCLSAACSETAALKDNGCVSCHRPLDGATLGLEIPHEEFALLCTDCHGGDPDALTKEVAHVAKPDGFSELRALTLAPLAAVDEAYLRFRAPTHPSVVRQSCGSASPQGVVGAGCHEALIGSSASSLHASLVGLLTVTRFSYGHQPARPPNTGVVPTANPGFQASTAPRFTYSQVGGAALLSLMGASPANPRPYVEHFNVKACTTCHLGVFGGGADTGNDNLFRGVGCAACHVSYAADGKSRSENPLATFDAPSHPEKHVVEREPDGRSCESCHNTSARIGLSFKGWREISPATPAGPSAQVTEALAFGRPAGTYVIDEDTTQADDETPPDVHQERGMTCADCHVGTDNHGDSSIRPNMGAEVGIECADCHGTFDTAAAPGEDGSFRTSRGSLLMRLSIAGGKVVFTGKDGQVRDVLQVSTLQDGLGRSAHNTSRHGELECYACHTAWMPNVLRTRRTLDLRRDGVDPLSGELSPGVVSEVLEVLTLDHFFLGQNVDGKVGTFQAQHGVYDVIASCDPTLEPGACTIDPDSARPGKKLVESYVGQSSEGRPGIQFWPVFAHTVRGIEGVRICVDCHPKEDGSNLARVRSVYGFGTGEHSFVDSQGRRLDPTKLIDPAGTSTSAIGHLLARPLPIERIQKALDSVVP